MKSNKFKKIVLTLIALQLTSLSYAENTSNPNSTAPILPSSTSAASSNNSANSGNTNDDNYAAIKRRYQERYNNSQSNSSSATGSGYSSSGSSASSTNSAMQTSLAPDKVVLNFENADIQSVIKAISKLSGKNFVIDPRIKGTVNIVSDKPISKSESYKVLESALRMQGFATVEADGVIKVVPETDAKTYGMQTTDSVALVKHQEGDQVITKVFVIEHGSATQLSNSLRPLIAPNNTIAVYPNSNALIITDYASNLARISKIISQLSAGTGVVTQPTIVTLHNAVAGDVAQSLLSFVNGGSSSGGGVSNSGGGGNSDGPQITITVDPVSNSIILYSPIQQRIDEIAALARKLDKSTGDLNSDLHVVYLKNADANHIADVLRVIATGQENPDLTATASQTKFAAEPTSTFNAGGGSGGSGGGGMSSAANRPSSQNNPSRNGANNSNNPNQKDQPKILIQAEPTTNSLIIQAPPAVYKNLRMIIDMLDVRRAQVMIEAMLADVNQSSSGAFGIQWLVGGGNNQLGAIAVSNYAGNGNAISSLIGSVAGAAGGSSGGQSGGAAAAAGLASLPNEVYIGLVTGTTTVGGQQVPNLGALADAISANSMGNVLSRPTLITLDNEEARILVGSNIGIPNGSYQNTAANPGNLTTTITRQDLGNVLQIKPLITQSGAIQLDIWQEDSLLDPAQPVNSANGPSFLKRNMRATVLVDDGQIIALGGMTRDSITINQQGIPLLSSIPYFGWLFSWQSRSHQKQNLVLFLRPVIIKNAEGMKALANQRYSYVLDQQNQIQAKGNLLFPTIKPLTLDNQVPYATQMPIPGPKPALNLNKNLPIVDLTAGGKNVNQAQLNSGAVSSTTTVISPSPAAPTNDNTVNIGGNAINLNSSGK